MKPEAIRAGMLKLVIKVSAITGWTLPAGNAKKVFDEQLFEFLVLKYPHMNFPEMEFAFLNEAGRVQDFGKQINLGSMAEVLDAYIEKRTAASKLEEGQPLPALLPGPKFTDADYMQWAHESADDLRSGAVTVQYLPVPLYEWLVANGKIQTDSETKKKIWKEAIDLINKLRIPFSNNAAIVLSKQIVLSRYVTQLPPCEPKI